jgi:hypothetical protein
MFTEYDLLFRWKNIEIEDVCGRSYEENITSGHKKGGGGQKE